MKKSFFEKRKKDSFAKIFFRPHEKRITEKRFFCRPLVPTRPRPPSGQVNNTNITVNRTVNKTVNKTVVNNGGTKQPSGLTSIPGIDSKMVERILAEKLEPTNQKME